MPDMNKELENSTDSGSGTADMVGQVAQTGIMGLINWLGANKQAQKQQDYQKELMDLQNQYNLGAMDKQFALAKEMYEYTGYASKVRQMKEAGLNPALMYGNGAGQGGTTGNGAALGVGQGSAPNMAQFQQNKIAIMGMGLQLQKLRSEIDVNRSVAEANRAAAEEKKTGTIPKLQQETENLKSTLDLIAAQTGSERVKKLGMELDNTYKTVQNHIQKATEDYQIEQIEFEVEKIKRLNTKINEEIRLTKGQADVQEGSINSLIDANTKRAEQLGVEIIQTKAQTKLTEEQAQSVYKNVLMKWEEVKMQSTGQMIDMASLETEIYKTLINNDAAMKREWVRALSNLVSSGIIKQGLKR